VIPDPEDDWDWGLPRAASAAKAISLGTSDDKSTRDEEPEGTINPVNIPVVRAECPTGNAGDFTDFMDDSSSTDSRTTFLHYSDSDEPYEYWTTARSFSRSPFSNGSSLSYEDSEEDPDPATDCSGADRPTEVASGTPSPIDQLQPPSPKRYRFSDLGVKRGWAGLRSGTASFNGPTSV